MPVSALMQNKELNKPFPFQAIIFIEPMRILFSMHELYSPRRLTSSISNLDPVSLFSIKPTLVNFTVY